MRGESSIGAGEGKKMGKREVGEMGRRDRERVDWIRVGWAKRNADEKERLKGETGESWNGRGW